MICSFSEFIWLVIKSGIVVLFVTLLTKRYCTKYRIGEYCKEKRDFELDCCKLEILRNDLSAGNLLDSPMREYFCDLYRRIMCSEFYISTNYYHSLLVSYGKNCESFINNTNRVIESKEQLLANDSLYFVECSLYMLERTVIPTYDERIEQMKGRLAEIDNALGQLSCFASILGLCKS